MEYRKIEYFLKAAEKRNIRKAADELFVSSQALSKQIIALEEEIGTELFIRTNAGITLTEAGSLLEVSFKDLYQQLDNTWRQYLKDVHERNNMVRIAFYRGLPQIAVVSYVTEYLMEHNPQLRLELIGCDYQDAVPMLLADNCDIVITNVHEGNEWQGCSWIRLISFPAKIIVSRLHPWCRKEKITLEDLKKESIITYPDCRPGEGAAVQKRGFSRELTSFPGNPSRQIISGDGESIMQQVILGKGYIIRPVYAVKEYIDRIQILDLPEERQFDIWIVIGYKENHPLAQEFSKMKNIQIVL